MTIELFTAVALFAFVSSITPGPNNTMLLASGANFGLARTMPHMAGVSLGFLVLILSIGLGLGSLFTAFPALHGVLQVAGAIYLVYLAWKIAGTKGFDADGETSSPQTFLQATAFQWVNPKAWAMGLGAMTTYVPAQNYVGGVILVALIFSLINLPCIFAWTSFGVALRRFLDRPGILRAFNFAMAALLIATLLPTFAEWVRHGVR